MKTFSLMLSLSLSFFTVFAQEAAVKTNASTSSAVRVGTNENHAASHTDASAQATISVDQQGIAREKKEVITTARNTTVVMDKKAEQTGQTASNYIGSAAHTASLAARSSASTGTEAVISEPELMLSSKGRAGTDSRLETANHIRKDQGAHSISVAPVAKARTAIEPVSPMAHAAAKKAVQVNGVKQVKARSAIKTNVQTQPAKLNTRSMVVTRIR